MLAKHIPLDIYGQDLYSNSSNQWDMVELQTDLSGFRYHSDLDVTSVTRPPSQVAKKLCKCGCGKEVYNTKWINVLKSMEYKLYGNLAKRIW